jgi:hypothetical protein
MGPRRPALLAVAKFLNNIFQSPHLALYMREFVAPFVPHFTQPVDEDWLLLLPEALPLMHDAIRHDVKVVVLPML